MDYVIVSNSFNISSYVYWIENVIGSNRNKINNRRIQNYLSCILTDNKDIVEKQLLCSDVSVTHTIEDIRKMWEYYNAYDNVN